MITAPGKDSNIGINVIGVNHQDYNHDKYNVLSNASCTTNCLAPMVKVINDNSGIIKGTMTTTHSYMGDQRILDASHRDLRWAQAAAVNIVPTFTGAAKAVALVIPEMKSKLNGIAMRVSTPNVSVVDLIIQVKKAPLPNKWMICCEKLLRVPSRVLYNDLPLVSCDYRGTDHSSTVDSSLTMVMGGDIVKVVAWYDNESGYSQRVVDLAKIVARNWKDWF